jgi:hypothetical protein
MPAYIKTSSTWRSASQIWIKVSSTWRSVSQGWINVSGTWRQFFSTSRTYTFSLGNTVHIGTNGYISLDSGQSAINISSTVDRVLGILPADLELNSIRYAADSSKFYMFYRGKRLGGTNFEIEYEVHFTDGQDYALIKLVAFPSSTYSLTGYYVDGSSAGYSRITTTRTAGAEYRVYFNTTAAFATSFTEFGAASHSVWLSQSTLTSGSADDGYISIVATQGSSAQAPTSVSASSITSTTATVSWTAPTSANSGMSAIQSYDYSLNSGGSWTSTSTNTSVNLTGLTASTSYTVLVRANNYYFTGTNYGSVTFSTSAAPVASVSNIYADTGGRIANNNWRNPKATMYYYFSNVTSATARIQRSSDNSTWTSGATETLSVSSNFASQSTNQPVGTTNASGNFWYRAQVISLNGTTLPTPITSGSVQNTATAKSFVLLY